MKEVQSQVSLSGHQEIGLMADYSTELKFRIAAFCLRNASSDYGSTGKETDWRALSKVYFALHPLSPTGHDIMCLNGPHLLLFDPTVSMLDP